MSMTAKSPKESLTVLTDIECAITIKGLNEIKRLFISVI